MVSMTSSISVIAAWWGSISEKKNEEEEEGEEGRGGSQMAYIHIPSGWGQHSEIVSKKKKIKQKSRKYLLYPLGYVSPIQTDFKSSSLTSVSIGNSTGDNDAG